METKKYEVRTRLFALKNPELSAAVLALFSGSREKPVPAAPRQVHVQIQSKRGR